MRMHIGRIWAEMLMLTLDISCSPVNSIWHIMWPNNVQSAIDSGFLDYWILGFPVQLCWDNDTRKKRNKVDFLVQIQTHLHLQLHNTNTFDIIDFNLKRKYPPLKKTKTNLLLENVCWHESIFWAILRSFHIELLHFRGCNWFSKILSTEHELHFLNENNLGTMCISSCIMTTQTHNIASWDSHKQTTAAQQLLPYILQGKIIQHNEMYVNFQSMLTYSHA